MSEALHSASRHPRMGDMDTIKPKPDPDGYDRETRPTLRIPAVVVRVCGFLFCTAPALPGSCRCGRHAP